MLIKNLRQIKREKRQLRIRRTLNGTAERPRLSVFRSNKNLSVQLINDQEGKTLFGISTVSKSLKEKIKYGGNVKAAEILGSVIAEEAKRLGIEKVVFDRGGYQYHGRVKALAEAARKGGLVF